MRKEHKTYIIIVLLIFFVGCATRETIIFEMNSNLINIYENIKETKNQSLLEGVSPLDISKLYCYSIYTRNQDVQKILVLESEWKLLELLNKNTLQENKNTQNLESLYSNMKDFKISTQTEDTAFVKYSIYGTFENETEFISSKQPIETTSIKLKKEGNIWKVSLGREPLKSN